MKRGIFFYFNKTSRYHSIFSIFLEGCDIKRCIRKLPKLHSPWFVVDAFVSGYLDNLLNLFKNTVSLHKIFHTLVWLIMLHRRTNIACLRYDTLTCPDYRLINRAVTFILIFTETVLVLLACDAIELLLENLLHSYTHMYLHLQCDVSVFVF